MTGNQTRLATGAEIVDLAGRRFGTTRLGDAGPLNGGDGGSTFDDMSWQEAVRRVDDKVDGNFKWVIGVFGSGFIALLIAFASAFLILSGDIKSGNEKLGVKLDAISTQLGDIKADIAVLKDHPPKAR